MDNLFQLGGVAVPDIGKVMSSTGPVVKCVLLRCNANDDDEDKKVSAETMTTTTTTTTMASSNNDVQEQHLHENLIEEILVDTTPRKSMVVQILGGPFTFLGQYEQEGIIVMIRRPDDDDDDDDDDNNNSNNHRDSRDAKDYDDDLPPINPHRLQPPLHRAVVRGDILLMKVAKVREDQDDDDEEEETKKEETTAAQVAASESKSTSTATNTTTTLSQSEIHMLSNEEFFLDYTREEYIKFARRTDIVAGDSEEDDDDDDDDDDEREHSSDDDDDYDAEEGSGEDGNGESLAPREGTKSSRKVATAVADNQSDNSVDEDFDPDVDDDDDDDDDDDEDEDDEDMSSETHQVGMMNMILGHLLSKFRQQNGRGPDSLELLEMRKALADKLGVEVPPVDEEACDWGSPASKMTTGKRKHNKKVVVAEEMNETEEIPSRRCQRNADDQDNDDEDEEDEVKERCYRGQDEAEENLEVSAQEFDYDDDDETKQPLQKKIKVNGGKDMNGSCYIDEELQS